MLGPDGDKAVISREAKEVMLRGVNEGGFVNQREMFGQKTASQTPSFELLRQTATD